MSSRIQHKVSRHVTASSFDGVVTEVGKVAGNAGVGEAYVVRCRRASETIGGLLNFGALEDPALFAGFHYQEGQWSFVMRKRSQSKD